MPSLEEVREEVRKFLEEEVRKAREWAACHRREKPYSPAEVAEFNPIARFNLAHHGWNDALPRDIVYSPNPVWDALLDAIYDDDIYDIPPCSQLAFRLYMEFTPIEDIARRGHYHYHCIPGLGGRDFPLRRHH